MPQLSFPISADGLWVPVMIGQTAPTLQAQIAAGQPVVRPIMVTAEIDTGANYCSVSPAILQQLGITSHGARGISTAAGQASRQMNRISLSIVGLAGSACPIFAVTDLEVSELAVPLPVDVLIGFDVVRMLQLFIDGPGGSSR